MQKKDDDMSSAGQAKRLLKQKTKELEDAVADGNRLENELIELRRKTNSAP